MAWKKINIHDLRALLNWQFRSCWAGGSASPRSSQTRGLLDCSHLGFDGSEVLSPRRCSPSWQVNDGLARGLRASLFEGNLCVLLTWHQVSPKVSHLRERGKQQFYLHNPALEVTLCHFCHFLLVYKSTAFTVRACEQQEEKINEGHWRLVQ